MKANNNIRKDNKKLIKTLKVVVILLSIITFICVALFGKDTFLNAGILYACLVLTNVCATGINSV